MHKKIFFSTLLLFLFFICKADFERIYLNTLLQESHLIIESRITKVLDKEIQVEITEHFKGDWAYKRLLVSKFESWTCAPREEYEVGQRQIFFLRKSLEDNTFCIMGAGNEGEIEIQGDSCYYNETHFLLADVKSALKDYFANGTEGIHRSKQNKTLPKTNNLFLTRIINER